MAPFTRHPHPLLHNILMFPVAREGSYTADQRPHVHIPAHNRHPPHPHNFNEHHSRRTYGPGVSVNFIPNQHYVQRAPGHQRNAYINNNPSPADNQQSV